MLKLEGLPRVVTSIVIASTATMVVGGIIIAVSPAPETLAQKVTLKVGGYGLGVAAGAIASKYTLENIDGLLDSVNQIIAIARQS